LVQLSPFALILLVEMTPWTAALSGKNFWA